MEIFALQVLPYFTTVIGFLIVWVLNGIKSEIKDVKTTVGSLEKDLREGITGLDRRVTKIETENSLMHHKGNNE